MKDNYYLTRDLLDRIRMKLAEATKLKNDNSQYKDEMIQLKKMQTEYGNMEEEIRLSLTMKWVAEDRPFLSLKRIEEISREIMVRLNNPLGIIYPYILDDEINEIMVNGYDKIFIEKGVKIWKTNISFLDVRELEDLIRYIAGLIQREFNEMNPILDARLKDGSRVNAVFRNVALGGPSLTIRKFKKTNISLEDMVNRNTMDDELMDFLVGEVKKRKNIFISGGTSSGKTTFLNALSQHIQREDRVVTIEDSAELNLDSIDNIVSLECRNANSMGNGEINMSMLIKTALRMRPNRIIVGEVRGKEVYDMLQAMNTGHDGSMSTGHGNSISGMLRRLEAMYLMYGRVDIETIRSQISEAIDIMIHLRRCENGNRVVSEIKELLGYKNGEYLFNDIYRREDE